MESILTYKSPVVQSRVARSTTLYQTWFVISDDLLFLNFKKKKKKKKNAVLMHLNVTGWATYIIGH